MRLLLGSGGFNTGERREGWRRDLDLFLGPIDKLLFIPYALADHDSYVAKMIESGFHADRKLESIHRTKDPRAAIEAAEVIYLGGGNSFRLLNALYELKLIDPIRRRVQSGIPFVGVSAGTNMACPTIKTTNDMPIVAPPSLDALNLIPFQINPHYFAGPIFMDTPEGMIPYGGETRDDRLHQFHEDNSIPVLALWEGAILRIEESRLTLSGATGARLFRPKEKETDYSSGADLSFLWKRPPSST